MEQDIYVDILVFLNTVINFFLLLVTAALAGRERKTRENSGGGIFWWDLRLDFASAAAEWTGADPDPHCGRPQS